MWTNNRYVGTRDPSKGGLYISATTEGFDEALKSEIYDTCLELITEKQRTVCTGIYPLSNGSYSIAMGYKVAGSARESRPHEVIRGIVADPGELTDICENYIAQAKLQKLFFPEAPDPDRPEQWRIAPEIFGASEAGDMEAFWAKMDYRAVLGFYHAIKMIKRKKYKIRLMVPEDKKPVILAACCMMIVQTGEKLFVVAGGECTITEPDLLLTDKLNYLDGRSYRSMTFEQFISMGLHETSDTGETDEKNDDVAKLIGFCGDYLMNGEISDDDLYQQIDEKLCGDAPAFAGFRMKLKNRLYHFEDAGLYPERYMKLLYIVFKSGDHCGRPFSSGLCTAPYDFAGMYLFLKKKAGSRREFRKYLEAMLETQFCECAALFTKRSVHEAAVNVIENI